MVLEETKERTVHHAPPAFKGVWTASQLRCERYCYLIARGIEGDFVESAVQEEGRLHEDDVIAKLQVKGIIVTDRQVTLTHPVLPLAGHPDGRVVLPDGISSAILTSGIKYLLDVKSMDRSFYWKAIKNFIGEFPHLYRQLQTYSLMSEDHESVYVPIKNRASGEVHELVLDPDEEEWDKIEDMINILTAAVKDPKFDYRFLHCPPADSISGKYCPYRKVGMCEHQTNIPDVTEAQVVQALSDYEEGKTLERIGGERKKDAKGIPVAYLKKHDVKKMKIGGRMPTLTEEDGRRSCDFERLRELSPKIYDEVIKKGAGFEKFEIR